MEFATINTKGFPVVEVVFNSIEATDENFDQYLSDLLNIHYMFDDFIIIFNAKSSSHLPLQFRYKQANWMKKNEEIIKKKCLGLGFYIPNIMNNAILNCIFVITRPSVQYLVSVDYIKVQEWAWKLIEKHEDSIGTHI